MDTGAAAAMAHKQNTAKDVLHWHGDKREMAEGKREKREQIGVGRDEGTVPESPHQHNQCYLLGAEPGNFLPSFLWPLFLLPAWTPSSKGG